MLNNFFRSILSTLGHFVFPKLCICCQELCDNELYLCKYCAIFLPWKENHCLRCGITQETTGAADFCIHCLRSPPQFDRTLALFHYQHPIDHWINAFKFHQQRHYAKMFGALLVKRIQDSMQSKHYPDCIIPVPLHAKRLRTRGYNQAYEIARVISQHLKLPLSTTLCQRKKATLAQSQTPSRSTRFNNLKQAFECKSLDVKCIAIVDDVMTTGFTVSSLAACLKQQGAEKIYIWCCARAESAGIVENQHLS